MSAFVCSVLCALSLYLVLAMALVWVWVCCWIAFRIELDKICVQKFCCNSNEPFWIFYRIHCWPNIKCDYNRAKCIGFRVNKAWVYCLSGEEVNVWEIPNIVSEREREREEMPNTSSIGNRLMLFVCACRETSGDQTIYTMRLKLMTNW